MPRLRTHFTFTCVALVAVALVSPAWGQSAVEVKAGRTCIGLGCTDAVATAEIRTSDNSTKLLVNEPTATAAGKVLMELRMPGQPQFLLRNTSTNNTWNIKASPTALIFRETASGGIGTLELRKSGVLIIGIAANPALRLEANGNMEINGTLTENSSREAKRTILPVDSAEVLTQLTELPIATWNYKDTNPGIRHMGPMAEDFHATFGLGKDDTGISTLDMSGVALAAIQELAALNEAKDRRIGELEAEQSALAAEVAEMRALVEQLLADR